MRGLPAGIKTRRVTSGDADAVTLILDEGISRYSSFAPEGWSPPVATAEMKQSLGGRFDGADAWGLLASADDDPAGVVSISTVVRADPNPAPPGSGYLWHMFVRPAWQGTGLAGALLDRALAEARDRGFERLVLWTPAGQAQARRFYEREGFTSTGNDRFNEEIGMDLVQYGRPTLE
jgi:GNAT superfamily N-acetyltransferase